ncbi:cytochrome-c peroxidase [Pseudoteredinibacter isoporae]|uniref:Methylamine utilization protein MauG n=1 Tax=Pseudoteredinibacter isoporae TaxID=570281 RepID=A0A7X0JS22_9GAMM|nr:cytochrome c peroxidase [Pseudoteredinibacter isoporae]MBB6520341.1 cytochrome c peroxidase [Pseudoteredinibacter isoporae]NHO85912.1 tryptophan tryptophylquinone biosynthesis enzyme MauG [Pseudoteredinibacter isoporae]NIB25636.1 tryptophan tryptophylquinone biosynthesis enzyme MauG [Pseudoteredinibacter isoporae]
MELLKQQWLLPEISYQERHQQLAALGKALFFDSNLSIDFSTSCATCHKPDQAWADGQATATGLKNKTLRRATPSIINTAYSLTFMWDGRSPSLEHQALMPIFNPEEMGLNADLLVKRIEQNPSYSELFDAAFDSNDITIHKVGLAIAEFERTIVSRNTRFDRWLKGDKNAMTLEEREGFRLFLDGQKSGCINCHNPPNFTDHGFHNIGLAKLEGQSADLGRFNQTPLNIMKGAFKTPSLRGTPLTAPYFHNGSANTLEEVVDHYQDGILAKENLSPSLINITLSQEDKSKLVAFLKTLQ